MATSSSEQKEKLAAACRILYNEGVAYDGKGHQCCLIDSDRILIPRHLHPYGLDLSAVYAEDIVTIDFDGKVLDGKHDEPMAEFYIYTAIFRKRSDVQSIIHVHPLYTNVLASAGQNILPISKESLLFRDGIAFYDRFPLYIGDKEHGDAAAIALGKRKALVHRGHGVVVVGKSIEDALLSALALEKAAKIQWMTSMLGQPECLPKAEMDKYRGHESLSDILLKQDFLYCMKKLEKTEKTVHK